MKFYKGMPSPNSKGRPKGSKNKKSEEMREFLTELFYKDRKTLQEYYNGLGVQARYKLFAEFAPYVIPRLSSTEIKSDYSKFSEEQLKFIVDSLKASATAARVQQRIA